MADKDGADRKGSRLVYSTDDPCIAARLLLEKHGGDVDSAVTALTTPPCSYQTARQLADAFAECFGITAAAFVRIYRQAHRIPR